MVLGTTQRTSEYQYSLKVALWQPEREGMTQCHKTPLRELWSSETKKNLIRLVLIGFEPCVAELGEAQSANNRADRQSVKTSDIGHGRGRGNVYPPQQNIGKRVGSATQKVSGSNGGLTP